MPAPTAMHFCPACGAAVDGAHFCPNCGRALDAPPLEPVAAAHAQAATDLPAGASRPGRWRERPTPSKLTLVSIVLGAVMVAAFVVSIAVSQTSTVEAPQVTTFLASHPSATVWQAMSACPPAPAWLSVQAEPAAYRGACVYLGGEIVPPISGAQGGFVLDAIDQSGKGVDAWVEYGNIDEHAFLANATLTGPVEVLGTFQGSLHQGLPVIAAATGWYMPQQR